MIDDGDRSPGRLADIIAATVALHVSGSNLRGTCPLHADGTRSLYVHPVLPIFHCFGCGTSGDREAWAAALSRL